MTQTIAIVDDEPDVLRMLRSLLSAEGYDAKAFSGGEALLSALDDGLSPDLFFVDVMMPQMDGFAVCTAIRERTPFADTPIVFLTAMPGSEAQERALKCGIDDFLEKPARRLELLARARSLLRLNHTSKELRARHALVMQQNAALEHARAQQFELSTMVVHDLKNPLAALRLNLRFLQADADTEDKRNACSESVDLTDIMLRRVSSILELAKSQSGKLTPRLTTVSLSALFERVVKRERSQTYEREIALRVEADPSTSVIADAELLGRVLENLIDNGIRHAPKGSNVTLRAVRSGDRIAIEVEDAGPGISPDKMAGLFKAFSQGDASHRASHNVGLGLAFCKAAVEAQGGTITAAAAQPHGLCVRLELRTQASE